MTPLLSPLAGGEGGWEKSNGLLRRYRSLAPFTARRLVPVERYELQACARSLSPPESASILATATGSIAAFCKDGLDQAWASLQARPLASRTLLSPDSLCFTNFIPPSKLTWCPASAPARTPFSSTCSPPPPTMFSNNEYYNYDPDGIPVPPPPLAYQQSRNEHARPQNAPYEAFPERQLTDGTVREDFLCQLDLSEPLFSYYILWIYFYNRVLPLHGSVGPGSPVARTIRAATPGPGCNTPYSPLAPFPHR
jgi:hypothetical protein